MVIYIQNTLELQPVIVVQLIFDGFFSFLSGTIPERILDRCENVQGITMEGNVCAVTYQLINYLMELWYDYV